VPYLEKWQQNEWRWMLAISNRPSHFKEPLPLYTKVMKLVNYNDFREFGDQCGFTFPPIHVFWGASPQNQTKFYLRVLELRNELLDRFHHKELRLHVGEWRSILRDTYWKWDAMPKLEDKYQPDVDPEFDPENPYVYGGELFFWVCPSGRQVWGVHCEGLDGLWMSGDGGYGK